MANLRDWIDGRGVLVLNADAYLVSAKVPGADIGALLDGWDGATVRMLGVPTGDRPAEFGGYRFAGVSLLPWSMVRGLTPEPADLVRTVWRPAEAAGALTVVGYPGTYLDTGTAADYLAANLDAAGDGNLVDPGATVTGELSRARAVPGRLADRARLRGPGRVPGRPGRVPGARPG